MGLVSAGVPWDVAVGMDPVMRRAALIAKGTAEGHTFDWNTYSWVKSHA